MRSGYQAVPSDEEKANHLEDSFHRKQYDEFANAFSEGKGRKRALMMTSGFAFAVLWLLALYSSSSSTAIQSSISSLLSSSDEGAGGEFDSAGRYIMRDFDSSKPMASFLNGLGGVWGVPMWAFYVNRGQGITSFGKQNKDSAIAKFVTAEKAYQQTPFTGFRTLIKGQRANGSTFEAMPFFPTSPLDPLPLPQRNMIIGLNEMEIEEVNAHTLLQTNVLYYTAPNQDFPCLVRKARFKNLDATQSVTLDVVDGLAKLVPNGLGNFFIDSMGRTMEAWMNVYNVYDAQGKGANITLPFFHISQDTADSAEVRLIKDGYFSLSYLLEAEEEDEESVQEVSLLPFIVDPTTVFGQDTSLSYPLSFFAPGATAQGLATSPQGTTSRTPCAFSASSFTLAPGASVAVVSVFGYGESLERVVGGYSPLLSAPAYSKTKRREAREVAEEIVKRVRTDTSAQILDAYIAQDFLDNVLRGGLPVLLGGEKGGEGGVEGVEGALGQAGEGGKVFHIFSRIHGDIERDYNYFQIDTTYFSQGPGNFRDVSQNRRVDLFHTPEVASFNVFMFLSFVQADGYNPLTVASPLFRVPTDKLDDVVATLDVIDPNGGQGAKAFVKEVLKRSFRPGQLFRDLAIAGMKFNMPREEVLQRIVRESVEDFAGQFNQNGYWSDHWTYTLDHVDSFLSLFPDQEEDLLYASDAIPFFFSPAFVRPRATRLSLVPVAGSATPVVRAYKAISLPADADFPKERQDALNAMYGDPSLLQDSGAGNFYQRARDYSVFKVSPLAKLLMLGVLKFTTLDAFGQGVEMEGGKPGWNDAMNGLPGLLGSGMAETYEMLRIVRYVKQAVQRFQRPVNVPVEFKDLLGAVETALQQYFSVIERTEKEEFAFWDMANAARESYRSAVVGTFQGAKAPLSPESLLPLLDQIELKVQGGIERALLTSPSSLSPTYFYYDCTDYSLMPSSSDASGPSPLVCHSFAQHTLPLFLEGPTRHLKVVRSVDERRAIYRRVRASPLFDEALQMYTLCESLESMGQELGRMKAFSPGWLENQSVWLHMSYKFYLELLRGGLYEEFFAEMKTGLVPFMDHQVYGRSPLEAASFIVSSAFPDRKMRGSSFAARLSGSTAEFLSMWALMFGGERPFDVNEQGELKLKLKPILPAWLFIQEGERNRVSFTFLGEVNVTYLNPSLRDSWQLQVARYVLEDQEGALTEVQGQEVGGDLARRVREKAFPRITVTLL